MPSFRVPCPAAPTPCIAPPQVYRGIDQEGDALGPSAAQLDPARGISVGSMSKAFAMAGVRLGWVVAPREVLEQVGGTGDPGRRGAQIRFCLCWKGVQL